MKKLKFTLFSFVAILISFQSNAQHWCYSDEMNNNALNSNPVARAAQNQLETFTSQFVQNYKNNQSANKNQSVNTLMVIPVVFHVLHQWGPENISDAQILDAVAILNRDYNKLNADTTAIIPSFQSIAGSMQVEFRLAQLDPNGNCTNGIDRIVTPLTYFADSSSKLHYWPMQSYLNIWTASSIGTTGLIAGYSYYPGAAPANKDGVIILHNYIGTIGTGSIGNSRALTHEVGHWLNLQHPWGSTNQPGVACGDDQVNDTPITKGWNLFCPQPANAQICNAGIIENYQNYMDYSYCSVMFTQGQILRMTAALNSPVAGRNNVWTPANLTATGTDGPTYTCIPQPNFNPVHRYVCAGNSVNIAEWSMLTFNSPVTRLWTHPGGTSSNDSSSSVTIQYNTPGFYSVSLTETTSAGSATTTIDSLVVVSPAPATSFAPYSEGFETITIPGNDFFTYNLNGGNAWSVFGSAGHTGSKSLRLNNYTGNKKGTDEFVLPAMNFSNAISLSLHYWLASAQKTASSIDTLKIWSSADCGSTWSLRSSKTGAPLYTVSTLIGLNFIPTAAQWVQQTVPIGIVVGQPDVRFRFTFFHDGANNIYIDDININGTLGTDQININPDEVSIFPNPASDKSSIGLTLIKHSDVTIKVNDVFGNLVYQLNKKDLSQGEYLFDIPLTWAKGIYFVRLNAGDQQVTQKLIVQ